MPEPGKDQKFPLGMSLISLKRGTRTAILHFQVFSSANSLMGRKVVKTIDYLTHNAEKRREKKGVQGKDKEKERTKREIERGRERER